MIQFHLSKTLAKDMAMHVQQGQDIKPGAMQWYVHRVTIERRKCVVVMELQTRYAIVFCGMTKKSFKAFPDVFIESLLLHVLTLVIESGAEDDDELVQALTDISLMAIGEHCYQLGSDRSVQAHIRQVVEHLESMIWDGYPLPVSEKDAFAFSMQANDMLRKRKGDKDYFVPREEFIDFWYGLFEHFVKHRGDTDNSAIDNVIAVDFGDKSRGD